jgi:phage gp36-like protein
VAYLREKDYLNQFAQAQLEQLLKQARQIQGDPEVRLAAEVASIERVKDRLRQRYKVDKTFTDLQTFNINTSYKWNDRIDFTADPFDATKTYSTGETVLYNVGSASMPSNKVYLKNSTAATAGTLPTNTTYFTWVGDESIYYITPPAQWDEDVAYPVNTGTCTYKHEYYLRTAESYTVTGQGQSNQISIYDQWADVGFVNTAYPTNASNIAPYGNLTTPENIQYWTKILDFTPYLVSGSWPSDSSKWTKGDNRSYTLIETVVSLSLYLLHGMCARQIPPLIEVRYKNAEQWLVDAAKGEISPDLPTFTEDHQKGFSIRFGSNPQTFHSY